MKHTFRRKGFEKKSRLLVLQVVKMAIAFSVDVGFDIFIGLIHILCYIKCETWCFGDSDVVVERKGVTKFPDADGDLSDLHHELAEL